MSEVAANTMDQNEQVARIERSQAETRKFAEETFKLAAETRKLNREASIAPFTAGAAVAGAAVAATALAMRYVFGAP